MFNVCGFGLVNIPVKDFAVEESSLSFAKAGLGTLVFHNKEWLCLIKPMKNVLVMRRPLWTYAGTVQRFERPSLVVRLDSN
jgi:hypothetical protein